MIDTVRRDVSKAGSVLITTIMKTSVFFSLCFWAVAVNGQLSDRVFEEYSEDLILRDLPDGKLLAHFEFTTRVKANTKPSAPCKTISIH